MVRPLRIDYPDAYYHVTCRGNERKDIFKDERDSKLKNWREEVEAMLSAKPKI